MTEEFDLSEEATPYKLEQARKEGSVAKSPDLVALAMLATAATMLHAKGWEGVKQAIRLQFRAIGDMSRLEWSPDGVAAWLSTLLVGALSVLAPFLFALLVVGILVNLLQTGPIFTVKPLSPDFNRLSPVNGFKRVFSLRIVYEAAKSLVKLAVLGSVAYLSIRDLVPALKGISALDPKAYAAILTDDTSSLLIKLVLVLLAISVIDLAYTRWEFSKRMRMSRRDVRDEAKNREGDPRIRAKLRELRKEMLKRSKALRKLPSADVLITNPTHLAVALSYEHGKASAPQVVAKGAGDVARKMREVASRHHIPIVQNRVLARALFREVDYDGFVPEKWYPQIAKIMVWVYAMRESRHNGMRRAA
jgi:flagellar biosynthetic protein FlhB